MLAYVVDYKVVPARLSPGFEKKIGPLGMLATYASFAASLYGVARARRPGQKRSPAGRRTRRAPD